MHTASDEELPEDKQDRVDEMDRVVGEECGGIPWPKRGVAVEEYDDAIVANTHVRTVWLE